MLYIYKGPYPPSTNQAYYNAPGEGRKLTHEAKEWQRLMPAFMAESDRGAYDDYTGVPWNFTFWLNLPPDEGDISNRLKLMEDAMAAFLGLNDKWDNEIHIKRTDTQPDGSPLPVGMCVAILMITGLGKPKPKKKERKHVHRVDGAAPVGGNGVEGLGDRQAAGVESDPGAAVSAGTGAGVVHPGPRHGGLPRRARR